MSGIILIFLKMHPLFRK